MNEHKSLLLEIAEAIDRRLQRRTHRDGDAPNTERRPRWLGRQLALNIGTLLMVVVLLLTVPALAAPLRAPSATSTSTISYQGRLADSGGNPLTGKYNLEFRIYDVPTGGAPLWTEMWTGGNAADVSDGLFNVMLGSIDATLASSIEGEDELYLGITVGTDGEMVPRVQLGSVPFSMQAMSVPDDSITTDKIASNAITTTHLLNGAVTTAKLDVSSGLAMSGTLRVNGNVGIGVADPSSELEVNGIVEASNLDRGYTAYDIGNGAKPNRQICKVACGGPDSDDNHGDYWIWDTGIYQTSTAGSWIRIAGDAHVVLCNGCAAICTCQPYRSW